MSLWNPRPDKLVVSLSDEGRWRLELLDRRGKVLESTLLDITFRPEEPPYEGPTDYFLNRGRNFVAWHEVAWRVSSRGEEWRELVGRLGWQAHVIRTPPPR